MKRIKLPPFSSLLTPILVIGTLLFAALVTLFSVESFDRERDHIQSYTHSRMKCLILDLEINTMSLEAAMQTMSHMRRVSLDDSTMVIRRLEQLMDDIGFVYSAGLDIFETDISDSTSRNIHVARSPSGYVASIDSESSEYEQIDEYNCCLEAYESGEPKWSRPYVDSEYTGESVVTCYLRMGDLPVMIYADVELNLLLHTIDSLQFYQDSRMYVTVPDGPTYTVEDGKVLQVEPPTYDRKDFYEIFAHYRHLDLDILDLVPNNRIFSTMLKDLSILLGIFILGLAFLSFCVHRAFKSSQQRLAQTIEASHEEQMARKHLEDEIAIAARIQNKMLTDPGIAAHFLSPGGSPVDLVPYISAAREVGGDLYEYRVSGDKLFVCIGDVSGKGIPSAMVMSRCSTLFHAYVSHSHTQDPADLLLFMNQQLCRGNEEVMFVTMWAGALNLKTGLLEYASAGHNPPVLAHAGAPAFLPVVQGQPLGMFEDSSYPLLKVQLEPVTSLLLYTDGITEAEGPGHVLFGEQKLLDVCAGVCSSCSGVLCDTLLKAVHNHAASCAQSDDITLVALAYGCHCAQLRGIGDVPSIHVLAQEVGASFDAIVAVEEAAVNAFTHGGASYVCVEYVDGSFVLYSDGDDFDPTQYVAPQATGDLPIGGRGIMLMRQCCTDIIYRRNDDGINILTLKM